MASVSFRCVLNVSSQRRGVATLVRLDMQRNFQALFLRTSQQLRGHEHTQRPQAKQTRRLSAGMPDTSEETVARAYERHQDTVLDRDLLSALHDILCSRRVPRDHHLRRMIEQICEMCMQKLYENIGGWFTCAVYGGGARRQCQPVESVACASPPSSGRERSTVRSRGRNSNRSIRAGRAGSSHRAGNCRAASCPCPDQFIIVRSVPPMNESLCRLAGTDEWQEQHGRLIEWRSEAHQCSI